MPIQAPQWTDYLNCPVCCREFGAPPRSPISLGCGHTLCRHCLKHLHRKQCPFDQAVIQVDPEELVVNTALLQLAGYTPPAQPYHPPSIQALPDHDKQAYDCIVKCMEHLAVYLKYCGNVNNTIAGSRLSRPMQRKLVMLLQCAITDEEGRGRAARAARSLGERTVTELILQHQNPQQLSANLWAAVRARGCQFLGPAMQEEVLKLVLLALEDGSALSRKVLVMFVVQRLEPHFPQASKTSIGHVVQLLYRASCFKVSKRECDSSLMQLKEEFRTYESLRREHDAQIVQIATEAGLRIAPDQWSALLYGDTAHKSHMQSIIDKLQTPQSFAQSVQELFIALQRTGDPAQLIVMSLHLDRLANIDASPDAKNPPWQQLAEVMTSLKEVVAGLIHYLQQQASGRDSNHNQKPPMPERCLDNNTSQGSPQTAASTPTHTKYKVSMCRDAATRSFCPRGSSCTFAHSEEELERFRMNGYPYGHGLPPNQNNSLPASGVPPYPPPPPGGRTYPLYIQQQPHIMDAHNFNVPPPLVPVPVSGATESEHVVHNGHHAVNSYPLPPIVINQEIVMGANERYYPRSYNVCVADEGAGAGTAPPPPPYRGFVSHVPMFVQEAPIHREELYAPIPSEPEFHVNANGYGPRPDAVWAPNPGEMFSFGDMLGALPLPPPPAPPLAPEVFPPAGHVGIVIPVARRRLSPPAESVGARAVGGPVSGPGAPEIPTVSANGPCATVAPRLSVGPAMLARDRVLSVGERLNAAAQAAAYDASGSDDQELEAGLQALERRIDTEFKMAD